MTQLKEIAAIFGRLGLTSFGGPAAHIAMMEAELVRRRKWISSQEFLDLLGATNLIPGPNSTELAIHIGHKVRGYPGLLVAGLSFITPAFVLVWALATAYVEYGRFPIFGEIVSGIRPVMVAIIAQALWSLLRSAIKDKTHAILAVFSLGLYAYTGNELFVLFLIAGLNLLLRKTFRARPLLSAAPVQVFLYFSKVGSVLFGSGYVLFAFLQSDLVDRLGWLSQAQLLDAITVGQITPGPVFTAATFVGYLVAGHAGAVLGTLGIFLPAFFFVALSAPFIKRIRNSPTASLVLDGLNIASLSLMAMAGWILGRSALTSVYGIAMALSALILLLRFKVNSLWIILGAALIKGALLIF